MKDCSDCKFCHIDGRRCSKLKRGFVQSGGCSYYKRDTELFNEAKFREECGMLEQTSYSQDYIRREERYEEEREYIY